LPNLTFINRTPPKGIGIPFDHAAMLPVTASIATISALTGISRSEIYRLLASNKLHAVKSGRTTLILVESVMAYVTSLPSATFRTAGEVVL